MKKKTPKKSDVHRFVNVTPEGISSSSSSSESETDDIQRYIVSRAKSFTFPDGLGWDVYQKLVNKNRVDSLILIFMVFLH